MLGAAGKVLSCGYAHLAAGLMGSTLVRTCCEKFSCSPPHSCWANLRFMIARAGCGEGGVITQAGRLFFLEFWELGRVLWALFSLEEPNG